jgi:integrase
LSDDELTAVWRAAEGLGEPYSAFVKLLILTSQRLSEVAGMRRQELDLDAKIWTLPAARCKNGREHQVPISDQTVEILRSLPKIADSEFVFTPSGRGPITGFFLIKRRIDVAFAANWTFHDLRRSFASGCARLGVDMHVVEKCLNHVSGSFAGIVGVYQRHDFGGEKRAAMDKWARHIEAIVSGEPGKVIELRA